MDTLTSQLQYLFGYKFALDYEMRLNESRVNISCLIFAYFKVFLQN